MAEVANKIIYSMMRVSKHYGQKQVLKDISLSYFYGAKIGVLGLNGSGKSTLLKILAGVEKEFEGETAISPGYTVGYLEQEPLLDENLTVRQIVEQGVQPIVDVVNQYNAINDKFAEEMTPEEMDKLIERQGRVQAQMDAMDAWDIDSRLEMAMDALRCPPPETSIKIISGGEKRRVALCRLLLQKPDILLLDEPTNHLDAETVAWLEHHLHQYKGTIIAITHDRYFLDNVTEWILELDRGEGIPWKGNYSSWLEQKKNRLQSEEKGNAARTATLEKELEWIKMSPKGKRTKSKARLSSYENMLKEDHKAQLKELQIFIPQGPRLGDIVIKADNVKKSFDDKLLFENMNFDMAPGSIVGVVGPNGAGKTTLFKMIIGDEEPTEGSLQIGGTVELGYSDQDRNSLIPDKTVWEVISNSNDIIMIGEKEINSRAYVAKFNFAGSDQQKKVEHISGGERNRVHLACMLKKQTNVLLLDEPTNDLDVNTMRALEEALLNYVGCAVIISHDRWFLDRIVTHILAFEGDSNTVWFEGTYSEYEEDKKKRLGEKAVQPHRIKYRQLTRD